MPKPKSWRAGPSPADRPPRPTTANQSVGERVYAFLSEHIEISLRDREAEFGAWNRAFAMRRDSPAAFPFEGILK